MLQRCLNAGGDWVEDAHAREIVRDLTVGQYVKQAEEVVMTAFRKKKLRSL